MPLDVPLRALIFLSLSGIIGFLVTDMLLFTAYGTVGPRIAMLFMALSPPITVGIAYLFLGETIGHRGGLGMILVMTGIFITVFSRQGKVSFSEINKEDKRGYIFALLACLGQPVAMVLTKAGIGEYGHSKYTHRSYSCSYYCAGNPDLQEKDKTHGDCRRVTRCSRDGGIFSVVKSGQLSNYRGNWQAVRKFPFFPFLLSLLRCGLSYRQCL